MTQYIKYVTLYYNMKKKNKKKKLNKIIFVCGSPLSIIVESRYNILWYLKNGYLVELWDLSLIYYSKDEIKHYFSGNKEFRYSGVDSVTIESKKECLKKLIKVKDDTIICLIDFNNNNNFWLRRLFKIYNILYFVGPVAPTYRNINSKSSNIKKIFSFFIKIIKKSKDNNLFTKIIRILNNLIFKYSNYYKKPVFTVSSGMFGRLEWMAHTRAKKFISVPSCDIIWKQDESIIDKNYGIFIDDTLYFSPDSSINPNVSSSIRCTDLKTYQKNLNNVFDIVENYLNIEIIIAASGKYKYGTQHPFGTRKVMYGKTNSLLFHSSLAITHSSNAVFQTLLTNQPVLFLTDETIVNEKEKGIIQIASLLNKEVFLASKFNLEKLKVCLNRQSSKEKIIENFFLEKNISRDLSIQNIIHQEIKKL